MQNILMMYFDGFPAYRLKLYGGMIETPHIEELVKKSKTYSNVIAPSPSTAMTLTSMFTGLFPHEFGRRSYAPSDGGLPPGTESMFLELEKMGYNTHVLWDEIMDRKHQKSRVNVWQGAKTNFFAHYKRFSNPYAKAVLDKKILKRYGKIWMFKQVLSNIQKLKSPWALFVRFGVETSPEFVGAAKGITNNKWDDEIYEIDHVVNLLFNAYPNNTRLILSSDHGRMHGEQGIWGYAFNLCEGTLKVPLIDYTPENESGQSVDKLISLINYKNIVLNRKFRTTDYLYADTAYADQWHRKTMVRKGYWKYIYHRDGWPCKEQFFDLRTDPHEMINLATAQYIDPYRDDRPKGDTVDNNMSPSALNVHGKPLQEVLPRHDWDAILNILEELREERKRIWAAQNVYE